MEQKLDLNDPSLYLLPNMMPYLYCFAVLMVVLENSEKASKLYEDVKKCLELPCYSAFLDMLQQKMPNKEKLVKKIMDASEVKPKAQANEFDLSNLHPLLNGLSSVINDYGDEVMLRLLFKRKTVNELEQILKKLTLFVQESFNRESDKLKGIYKITTSSSPTLAMTIYGYCLAENKGIDLLGLTKIPAYKIRGKTYTMGDLLINKTSRRKFYKMVNEYEDAGFKLKHVVPMVDKAILWYNCRIKYQGPAEYCKQMSLNGNDHYDPANISHQMKEIDEALNYPRES